MIKRPGRAGVAALIGAALIGLTLACDRGDIVELNPSFVLVYGKVTSSTGVPIARAVVTIVHHPGACNAAGIENDSSTTDSLGSFRKTFPVVTSTDGCLRLVASAAGFRPDSVALLSVPFRLPPAVDSIQTNFVLLAP
jgi:hypothetical protein